MKSEQHEKDEQLLRALTEQLRLSNAAASKALDQALTALNTMQAQIRVMQLERLEK